jgi:arylsulfatase A-like enzyme
MPIAFILSTILLFSAFTSTTAAAEKPLNVLLFLADDWRFDTLGCAGNPVVRTPNLDALAKEGVRFTHAGVTTSICGVSRATILTGQWMSRHGNRAFAMFNTPWSETFPGILRANGYYVGHVGKWHCGSFPAREFDFGRAYSGRHWIKDASGAPIHVTAKNEQDSLDFLRARPKDKPFCLSVCFFAAHAEDGNPEQYLPQEYSAKWYDGVTIPVPRTATDEALRRLPPFLQEPSNEGRVRWKWRFDTPEKYQKMMRNYYRLVSEVDQTCGRLLDELRSQGVLDSTLIIFTGDNGYFHGERRLADKWYPYDESIRVPMIVRDPRTPSDARGTTRDAFVLNADIAPTILSATGQSIPRTMQGRDMAALYTEGKGSTIPQWRTEFFYEHAVIGSKGKIPASQALVTRDFKYSFWPDYNFEELYDLRKDPDEQVNLVSEPAMAATLSALKARFTSARDAAR